MKPQQILNKLAKYNEVQKVELSAEPMKVELALIDDIKARSNALVKEIAKLTSISNEVMEARKKAISMASIISDIVNAQQKEINIASQSLKELGIDTDILKYHNDKVAEALFEVKDIRKKIGF
jgi:hypothetical protein